MGNDGLADALMQLRNFSQLKQVTDRLRYLPIYLIVIYSSLLRSVIGCKKLAVLLNC